MRLFFVFIFGATMSITACGMSKASEPEVADRPVTWSIEGESRFFKKTFQVDVAIDSYAAGALLNDHGCLADPDEAPRLTWSMTCVPLQASLAPMASNAPSCSTKVFVRGNYRVDHMPVDTDDSLGGKIKHFWSQEILNLEGWRAHEVEKSFDPKACTEGAIDLLGSCEYDVNVNTRGYAFDERNFWISVLARGCAVPGWLQENAGVITP